MAQVRPVLLDYSIQLPGSRVLEDRYGVNLVSIVTGIGQTSRLAFINECVEEAKTSGLVQRAIEHADLRGVQAAS
jgi:polar amino acid transport system substrate-binding protein